MIERHSAPEARRSLLFVLIVAIALPTLYTLYARHAWEDWYITFRASKNLALGNGLVFTPGQRVHSFTSPLGTLIPALLSFLSLNRFDDLVLDLYRGISILVLAATSLNLYRLTQSLALPSPAALFILGMVLLDVKILSFSTNGMETAFVVFFLSLAITAQILPMRRAWLWRGIAWAGMLWSRPDGIVYILALTVGDIIFHFRSLLPSKLSGARAGRHGLSSYGGSFVVLAVLYSPWLIATQLYYGTFIPHTVLAKGLAERPISPLAMIDFFLNIIPGYPSTLDNTFMPPYADMGVGQTRALRSVACSAGWRPLPG